MSITHTVLFQFKDNVDQKDITKTCDDFLQLKDLCIHPTSKKPYIISLQGGKDNSPEGMQNGITHGFVATFESAEDRDYYVKTDPAHQAFIAKMSFKPTNEASLGLGLDGSQTSAGLRQLTLHTLDQAHQDTAKTAIARILEANIAEITYAQIVDGLPLGEVAFESRGGMPHQDHPINHCHDKLCDGILDRTREFHKRFDLDTLQFDSSVAVILFSLDEGLHKNDGVIEWAPPKSDKIWWSHCPDGPEPTMFFHPWYLSHDRYPNGVADMVGYWAESRVLGGVVLFDRRQPVPGSSVDQDAVYIHPDRDDVTYRICRLTSEQKLQLLNLLTADEPGQNPLPILPDETNDYRIDPEEPPKDTGIYRDIWDRSELREDAYDQRLRDVWNKVDYLTHSDKGNAGDRALERRNRIFYAYSDEEP
ncbi:hypothetical protein FNAPI_2169 [Fusarium napiforme]|uniref:Stress-response A/B barrel domain-containing protein n=1 Tax=Fusarium napiforme TaxID=42672 RepID=A0A8H5K1K6_9HYPO|nr:hypothetical protein FNAPI_2169 [Fusarium napiforme]